MGVDIERKQLLQKCLSDESIQDKKVEFSNEEKQFDNTKYVNKAGHAEVDLKNLKRGFPKTYKNIPTDICHWVTVNPLRDEKSILSNKSDMYLKTLTYKEIDDLPQILLNKMRYKILSYFAK